MLRNLKNALAATTAAFTLFQPLHAHAQGQDFPTKPVRVIVPFPAGGISDAAMRGLGELLSKRWGQPVIVDNRPGASTVIGTQAVVRAEADGYTLLFGDRSVTVNPFLFSNMPYVASRDLAPVAKVLTGSMVVAVPAKSPVNSMQELIAAARAKPNALNYASFGMGSFPHIDTEILLKKAGVTATHVPYKGLAEVMTALQGGDVDFGLAAVGLATPLAKSGKLKVLAYLAPGRYPDLPNVPSATDLGLTTSNSWMGMLAPAGTPPAVVDKISRDIQAVTAEPAFKEKYLKSFGLDVTYLGPQAFLAALAQERDVTGATAKALNVKPE